MFYHMYMVHTGYMARWLSKGSVGIEVMTLTSLSIHYTSLTTSLCVTVCYLVLSGVDLGLSLNLFLISTRTRSIICSQASDVTPAYILENTFMCNSAEPWAKLPAPRLARGGGDRSKIWDSFCKRKNVRLALKMQNFVRFLYFRQNQATKQLFNAICVLPRGGGKLASRRVGAATGKTIHFATGREIKIVWSHSNW